MRKLGLVLAAPLLALAAPAAADGGLTFLIDGDTFTQPFTITNTSTAGERVLRFGFDLGSSGFLFDTVTGGPPGNGTAGVPFTPVGGAAATGLVGPVTVGDGATFFQIDFTGFGPGESFSWDIDIDPTDPDASPTVFGNLLIRTTAFIDFSNGLRATGVLAAVPGNLDAAAFGITSITPSPGIPEPATWATMILGTGAVGGVLRRGRRTRARAALA